MPAFLVGWQLMVAAMMLPSAIPMLAVFGRVSARDERPGAARAAFLGAYLLVWTAFGVVACAGDAVLHRLVAAAPSVAARPWLIEGGVLVLAGLAQFTDLKHRCLTQCRTPSASSPSGTGLGCAPPSPSGGRTVCSASAAAGRSFCSPSPSVWGAWSGWPS
ncbi:MAG TPA: DUF2182 domain-containing protein [Actinomycetota bacterium]|nr:DUF2182 domain-containing protein [Actinomycetota bacterium]